MQAKTKTVYRVHNPMCKWSVSFKTLGEARECAKHNPMFKLYPDTGKSIIEKITTITTRVR